MNPKNAHFITKLEEIVRLRRLFCSKFKVAEFPKSINDTRTMYFDLISGVPMWIEYSYNQVIELLKAHGDEMAYILPRKLLEGASDELYLKLYSLKQLDEDYIYPATKFSAQTTYKEFCELFAKSLYYNNWVDFFIYGESLSWVLQNVSYKQMFILFFEDPDIISKTTIPEDVLYDLESFLKNCSDEVDQKELDALKEYWLPNQYKFDMK